VPVLAAVAAKVEAIVTLIKPVEVIVEAVATSVPPIVIFNVVAELKSVDVMI